MALSANKITTMGSSASAKSHHFGTPKQPLVLKRHFQRTKEILSSVASPRLSVRRHSTNIIKKMDCHGWFAYWFLRIVFSFLSRVENSDLEFSELVFKPILTVLLSPVGIQGQILTSVWLRLIRPAISCFAGRAKYAFGPWTPAP